MNVTQLKASMQLAEMRLRTDPSKDNEALYKQAKAAYEKEKSGIPAKTEDSKNDPLSLDNLTVAQKEYLDSLAKPRKVAVVPPAVSKTEETETGSEDEKGSDTETEEKKTEE